MSLPLIITGMLLTVGTPLLLHFGFKMSGAKMKYAMIGNVICFAVICIASIIFVFNGGSVMAEGATQAAKSMDDTGLAFIAAALATGFSTIGAGIAVATAASSAIGAISENPEIMGKSLIFVALAEGIALYGLILSILILGKI